MSRSVISVDVTVVSLTINALVLIVAISSKIFNNILSAQYGWLDTCHGESEVNQNIGKRASRTSARVLISTFAPVAGLYLLLTSNITEKPFQISSPFMSHCFAVLLAFYIVEFLVPFLDSTKPFTGYSEICHHTVSILLYLGILLTQENALLGLVGLLAVGDIFMQEVVSLCNYFPHRKQTIGYLVCLFLRAVALGTYRIILPLVTFCVAMANGGSQVRLMSAINIGMFFFSVVFFTVYYGWFYVTVMRGLYLEFKKAVPRGKQSKKTTELKTHVPAKLTVPTTGNENPGTVKNEYVFDLSATNLGLTDACSGVSTKMVYVPENGLNNEPTHYYI